MTLCRRVVIMLCLCDGVLHRTKKFVPDYRYTTKLVGNRNADEVVVIDVTPADRRLAQRHLFYEALQSYAAECFSPITVGGGIRTVEEVAFLMRECAADKVVIGMAGLRQDPTRPSPPTDLARRIVEKFGRQAFVLAINHHEADPERYRGAGSAAAGLAALFEPGEILLNSVDRDGSLRGYDLGALRDVVAQELGIPIMVAGGCGTWAHMAAAFEAGADAACTSVIHHLTETSLAACKKWLAANCRQPVRAAA